MRPHKAKFIHRLLWRGIQISFSLYLRLNFRVVVKWHSKPPKTAYLLVGNHANRNDPFIIGGRLRTPINYMANIEGVKGLRKFFSTGIGCFNIKKGRADRQAFIEAIQLVKQGYSVGIFPEGDRSWFGDTVEFSSAATSLAKKMKVPVVMARLTGHYFSRPRWSDIPRRGKIFLDFDCITQEEVSTMDKNEIYERIAKYIKSSDFDDERLKSIEFTGENLAVGVENIIWKCPKCLAEDQILGEKDEVVCKACNTAITVNGNQNLVTEIAECNKLGIVNLRDWFNWQLNELKLAAKQNAVLTDDNVELIEETSENVWESLGLGDLSLSSESFLWKNSSSGKAVDFPKEQVLNLVDNFNEYGIINLTNKRYRVVFNTTCSLKWTSLLPVLGYNQ